MSQEHSCARQQQHHAKQVEGKPIQLGPRMLGVVVHKTPDCYQSWEASPHAEEFNYCAPLAIFSRPSRTHSPISVGSVGRSPTASAPSLTAWSSVSAAG